MKLEQKVWQQETGWRPELHGELSGRAQLVILFGSTSMLGRKNVLEEIRKAYPGAFLFGCSTAGEIAGTRVLDESLVVTPVRFESSRVDFAMQRIGDMSKSRQVGERLAGMLAKKDLVHVFVLSEGIGINGSELVKGLTGGLPETVSVTGGLAGDGGRFEKTCVIWNEELLEDAVIAVGFYGDRLKVGFGSVGGWDPFGPERLITRSSGNVLYELDSKSALELYKKYLGEQAKDLPASGLLFPLSLRIHGEDRPVVRTLLSVGEEAQSMTFAGDVPEGSYARMMKANFDRLIDGAIESARSSRDIIGANPPELALLISCVGRRLILKQRIEEEVEGIADVYGRDAGLFGRDAVLTGFYSYGEIAPCTRGAKCELHNQTMTITALTER